MNQHGSREKLSALITAPIPAVFLILAHGPRSKVADDFALGQNTQFLLGAEAEYVGMNLPDNNAFYCFLDQKLAHGDSGWVIPGVRF